MSAAKRLYAPLGRVPVEDRVAVVECIKTNGPMDTATIRHHMSTIDWSKERTDAAVAWLRKHEVIYHMSFSRCNYRRRSVWGVRQ